MRTEGVKSCTLRLLPPSVADYRDTSPEDGGGNREGLTLRRDPLYTRRHDGHVRSGN